MTKAQLKELEADLWRAADTRTRDLLLPRLISGKLPVEALPIAFPPSMADAPPIDPLANDFTRLTRSKREIDWIIGYVTYSTSATVSR